jgi:hypothetical protein
MRCGVGDDSAVAALEVACVAAPRCFLVVDGGSPEASFGVCDWGCSLLDIVGICWD